MVFFNDYYHGMDRNYSAGEEDIMASEVGESTMISGTAVGSVNAKIFSGANRVELGLGRLSDNLGKSVEEVSKEERNEIKDLIKLNKIRLSTHADINAIGFAGKTDDGFIEEKRKANINQVKKAIDFASDVANEGAVVVHTGEWYSPVTKHKGFEPYEGAEKKEVVSLVNEKDGRIINLRKNIEFDVPVKTGKIISMNGDKYPEYKKNKQGGFQWRKYTWKDAEKESKESKTGKDAGIIFYNKYAEGKIEQSKGEALRYKGEINNYTENKNQVTSQINFVNNIPEDFKNNPNLAKNKLKQLLYDPQDPSSAQRIQEIDNWSEKDVNEFVKNKISKLKQQENHFEKEIVGLNQYVLNLERQYKEQESELKKIKPIEEYGLEKTADSFAELGIYAMEKSKGKKNPLFVAPENWVPEGGYGAHPDELRKIVIESRKAMANRLLEKGYNKRAAEEKSKEHIKATFDIAHANVWRKYFKGSDKEFDKWVVGEAKKLAKEGIIGHAHISDNLGYSDSHLSIGEGNTPVKSFVKEMKKAGFKAFITEGGQSNFATSRFKAWRHLGAKMSLRGTYAGRGFNEINESYLSQRRSPNFIHGEYAPSNEFRGAPFYSGLPLE